MGPMEVLSHGHLLAEGPRELPDGSVLFSDVVAGGVFRIAPGGGAPEVVVEKRRGIGGLLPDASGRIVVTGRDLAVTGDGGELRTLLAPEGSTGLNDLTSDGEGGVLVGVLRFRPMAGEEPVPGEVWHVPASGEPSVLAEGVLWPNGIGISPDGTTIYVSDFAESLVLAYDRDGGGRRVFARAPRGSCDGLAVDTEGGVWTALGPGGGVARFGPDGAVQEILEIPGEFVSSVAFAGPELRELIVTTATSVLRTGAPVAGMPVAPASFG
jgi:sugar lactone lactonase YvrE